jgi:hypothetical protein
MIIYIKPTHRKDTHMRDLTLIKRQQTLDYIRQYRRTNHRSPTLAEIGQHVYGDEAATGNVSRELIKPLIKAGWLVQAEGGGARAILIARGKSNKVYYEQGAEETK